MPAVGTGGNNTPLGKPNSIFTSGKKASEISLLNPAYLQQGGNMPSKRSDSDSEESASERKRRRRSRWGNDDKEKTFIPGMPTVLPANLSKDQEEAYLVQLQIEEMSRRLRTGDLGIPLNPEERSPSPEPIYNSDGKRLNTREYRTRKKLEDDRHALIMKMMALNPHYKPPTDYNLGLSSRAPVVRVSDKVIIPQDEHPDINFVGLLIGPRGNTLKAMEKETGAKIIIRGKGSVKEGKVGRKDGQPLPGEDEPLHAYVTANNTESVQKAVDKIKDIIRQGIEVPEGQNDLRRSQLRELALLNGTLRENDGQKCGNCGALTHKSWQCPEKPNITNTVICTVCGGAGHISKDCRQRKPGIPLPGEQDTNKAKIDEEYMSLMAELGEGPPVSKDDDSEKYSVSAAQRYVRPLFDPRVAPRPLMPPPPPKPPGCSDSYPDVQSTPMSTTMWAPSQAAVMPVGGVPPPMMATPAPPGVPQWPPQMTQGPSITAPPPGIMQAPPPPAATSQPTSPVTSSTSATATTAWMTQAPPPWHQGPPPPTSSWAPPRPATSSQPLPWQQGYMGVPPPPPPVQPPPPSSSNIDLNALAQAGLPNLLAAPPPPPPS